MTSITFLVFSLLGYRLLCHYKILTLYKVSDLFFYGFVTSLFYLSYDRLDFYLSFYGGYRGTSRGYQIHTADVFLFLLLFTSFAEKKLKSKISFSISLSELLFILFSFFTALSAFYAEEFLPATFVLWDLIRIFAWFYIIFFRMPQYKSKIASIFLLGNVMASFSYFLVSCYQRFVHDYHRTVAYTWDSNELGMFGSLLAIGSMTATFYFHETKLRLYAAASVVAALFSVALSVTRSSMAISIFTLIAYLVLVVRYLDKTTLARTYDVLKPYRIVIIGGLVLGGAFIFKDFKARFEARTAMDELNPAGGRIFFWQSGLEAFRRSYGMGIGLNNYSWWASREFMSSTGECAAPYPSWDRLRDDYKHVNEEDKLKSSSACRIAPVHTLWILTLAESGIFAFAALIMSLFIALVQMFKAVSSKTTEHKVLLIHLIILIVSVSLQSVTEWSLRSMGNLVYFMFSLKIASDLLSDRFFWEKS